MNERDMLEYLDSVLCEYTHKFISFNTQQSCYKYTALICALARARDAVTFSLQTKKYLDDGNCPYPTVSGDSRDAVIPF